MSPDPTAGTLSAQYISELYLLMNNHEPKVIPVLLFHFKLH